jgi:rod shape-determining protein MreD
LLDVGNDALIGQHALSYSVLAFLALAVHRRILWFPLWQQALHLLLLLLSTQLLTLAIRIVAGANFPGWSYFAGSFICAVLWPVLSFLLLLPQRQAEMKDENRPI